MTVPKPKPKDQPQPTDHPGEEGPGPGLDELVDNPELLEEFMLWEAASDEDFWKLEQNHYEENQDQG